MPRFELLFLLLACASITACVASESVETGEPYALTPKPPTDGLVGSNYTPAYAVNQVQLWHDFRSDVIEKELAAAAKHFGINTLRVYLHDINFFQEKPVFMANLDEFIRICDRHGIKPGFVFFDSCHRHEGIYLDRPTEPVPGFHNSRWAQSPQARDLDPGNLEKFKPYIQEIIRPYRADPRVLFWEIHNEPRKGDELRDRLKRAGYAWAKELKPTQPVLNCEHKGGWGDCEVSDIVDSHVYNNAWGLWEGFLKQNPAKGIVYTEAGARWKATRRIHGSPTDIMSWLESRRKANKSTPGVYLCWELMVGHSNCRWHWVDRGHERGKPDPEPEIPWCGMMWPDATPVSLAEAAAVRAYVTGKPHAMFFESFESGAGQWKLYGTKWMKARHGLYVDHGKKAVAGDTNWTDYILEGRVLNHIHWIKGKRPKYEGVPGRANGGLLFRVNDPGNEYARLRAYSISFHAERLMLGKFSGGRWKELAAYDTSKLPAKPRINEWSMIRVEAKGASIRVWFNRYHGDPDRGLRIEYTDTDDPILSGAIGVNAWKTTALFDDIVVLGVE